MSALLVCQLVRPEYMSSAAPLSFVLRTQRPLVYSVAGGQLPRMAFTYNQEVMVRTVESPRAAAYRNFGARATRVIKPYSIGVHWPLH